MSYFDVYEVNVTGTDDEPVLTIALDGEADHSFTDGEEMGAASTVVDLMDALDNGQALVITRTVF